MAPVLRADLEAIRTLATDLGNAATDIRGIDVNRTFAGLLAGLKGSDVAAALTTAEIQIEAALTAVATRVDALAQKNKEAARTVGITDEQYADSISGLLKL
ncbi:hypothetical protein DFR67_106326 [Williamsia limnetica]|uniref:Excreted virulence factor EspC (Type VII ESX diderm) n=1 Tax=Williamsia limnetica TaxID=882452 RepID=A0A318RJA3_WILLI|nr:hypothetical protein [Williamsia limnetica]PYE17622.1 hypothetical protein DFR67_106326 [Williamsia limnetica]